MELLAYELRTDNVEVVIATCPATCPCCGPTATSSTRCWSHAHDAAVSDTKIPVLDDEALYGELGRRFPGLRRRIVFLTGDVMSRDKRAFPAPWC